MLNSGRFSTVVWSLVCWLGRPPDREAGELTEDRVPGTPHERARPDAV